MSNLNRQLPPWMQAAAIQRSVPAQPATLPSNAAQVEVLEHSPGVLQQPYSDLYGDAVTLPIVGAANTSVLALQRPPPGTRRTFLLAQNQLVGTILFFAFGRGADNGLSNPGIPANGNLFMDQLAAVPQNELYFFFPIAGFATITYINAPITRVTS